MKPPHHRMIVALILALLMGAYGQAERAPASTQQAGQSTQNTATLTTAQDSATQAVLSSTVEAQLANDQKTAMVVPTAAPRPTGSPEPTLALATGWLNECASRLSPGYFHNFNIGTCYRIKQPDHYVTIFSGGYIDTPLQGQILVIKENFDHKRPQRLFYVTPQQAGLLTLQAVSYPTAQLQSSNGSTFIFNLETRQWLTLNGTPFTPTPTSTHLPTSRPPTVTPTGESKTMR